MRSRGDFAQGRGEEDQDCLTEANPLGEWDSLELGPKDSFWLDLDGYLEIWGFDSHMIRLSKQPADPFHENLFAGQMQTLRDWASRKRDLVRGFGISGGKNDSVTSTVLRFARELALIIGNRDRAQYKVLANGASGFTYVKVLDFSSSSSWQEVLNGSNKKPNRFRDQIMNAEVLVLLNLHLGTQEHPATGWLMEILKWRKSSGLPILWTTQGGSAKLKALHGGETIQLLDFLAPGVCLAPSTRLAS